MGIGAYPSWTPLRYSRTTVDVAISSKYLGAVVVESGAAAAVVQIRDGTVATDPIIMTLQVPANESRVYGAGGMVLLQTGIFVDVDTNTDSVTVFYG